MLRTNQIRELCDSYDSYCYWLSFPGPVHLLRHHLRYPQVQVPHHPLGQMAWVSWQLYFRKENGKAFLRTKCQPLSKEWLVCEMYFGSIENQTFFSLWMNILLPERKERFVLREKDNQNQNIVAGCWLLLTNTFRNVWIPERGICMLTNGLYVLNLIHHQTLPASTIRIVWLT